MFSERVSSLPVNFLWASFSDAGETSCLFFLWLFKVHQFLNILILFSLSLCSVRGDSSGQSVRAGRDAARLLHHSHHEWTGACRHLCCFLHDLRTGLYVSQVLPSLVLAQKHNRPTSTLTFKEVTSIASIRKCFCTTQLEIWLFISCTICNLIY